MTGFLEARAERTKTSVTLERKIRFLPVAVPLDSFLIPSWVPVWIDLRKQAGLHGDTPHPMLPSPQMGGGWSMMPLSVGAAADWLRSLVKVESTSKDRLATHSCKATMLSVSAKFGLDHATRRLLGYHSSGRDQSLLTYSRDAMSAPLRKLVTVITAVRTGNPDEEEAVVSELVGHWAPPTTGTADQQYARHRVSRCIHAIRDESGLNFTCGRVVSNRYVILLTKPAFMHPLCSGCFRT